MKKNELIKECISILQSPKVSKWYEENLKDKSQVVSLVSLENAVADIELTVYEALVLAFICGLQWDMKFKGVP